LRSQLAVVGHDEVDFIANFSNTDTYWTVMAEVIRPQGKIVCIVENEAPLDLNLLKSKSATFAMGVHVHPLKVPDHGHG
jgi:hypothetical protein